MADSSESESDSEPEIIVDSDSDADMEWDICDDDSCASADVSDVGVDDAQDTHVINK